MSSMQNNIEVEEIPILKTDIMNFQFAQYLPYTMLLPSFMAIASTFILSVN